MDDENKSINDLASEIEPEMVVAFLLCIAAILKDVVLVRLIEAIERRQFALVWASLGIERDVFSRLETAIEVAHRRGGDVTASSLKLPRDPDGYKVVFRFDMRNPEAEAWLRRNSSGLITQIVEEQKQTIQQALEAGLQKGLNPRNTALDIAGRLNRVTGRREGGVIGLTPQQEAFSRKALEELTSSDTKALKHYLTRSRRDKRFDRAVVKAIKEGRPVDVKTAQKAVAKYRDRLLKLRADTIARTETMTALHASQSASVSQAIAAGKLQANQVSKIWHTAADERVRGTHRALNSQKVAFSASFVSPSGATLRYPGDENAPAKETVMCRCWMEIKTDFLKGIR